MVREPLALVVSTYLYHKGGKEPTFGRPPLAPRLKKASVRAGLRMAADETLRRALPAMVGFHEKRPGATFRLEEELQLSINPPQNPCKQLPGNKLKHDGSTNPERNIFIKSSGELH